MQAIYHNHWLKGYAVEITLLAIYNGNIKIPLSVFPFLLHELQLTQC